MTQQCLSNVSAQKIFRMIIPIIFIMQYDIYKALLSQLSQISAVTQQC